MATLLITKETGGYFSFVVDGNTAEKVTNMRNDVLSIGTICNFKTANGANIIKKQNIDVTAITLVASGTFTFADVNTFLIKLIDVGYYDWLLTGGGGTGVDRFDELLDTFSYFGKDGQCVIVNESELKLETTVLYNKRKIVELEDVFSAIVPNKMLVTNEAGDKIELADLPTPPEQFLNAIGSFHYADLATQTVPLTIASNVETLLTNDTLGAYTDITQAPYGVSSTWDSVNNQFDFSSLSIGDLVHIRPDLTIDLTGTNTSYEVYMKFAVGTASEWTLSFSNAERKSTAAFKKNSYLGFDIGNEDTNTAPAEIWIKTDANATVKVNGWYVEVLRKNINITNFEDTNAVHKTGNETIDGLKTFNDAVIIEDGGDIQFKDGLFKTSFNTGGLTDDRGIVLPDKNGTIALLSDITGGSETTTTMGALINSAGNATPNDTDFVATAEIGGLLKKITWTNVKSFLKTYFDTIYTTTAAVATQITTALSGYASQSWVTSQGFITNVISALGFTPANKAGETFTGAIAASNLSGTNTGDQDLSGKQDTLVSGTNIKTINGTSVLGSGDMTVSSGGGDMVLANAQTVSGLKTFLSGMFGLRNVANTFTSFFTNSNTVARTYTLQNRDGTLADLTDIAGVNSGKMNTPSGTVNYLSKFLTATTIGLSRLFDNGTFFGIGTVNTPTKDITLGNQADRVVGVEDSDNNTKGRDIKFEAGRTVNFVPNSNFNLVAGNIPKGFCGTSNGDVFYTASNQLWKQTGGAGAFVSMAQTTRDYRGLCSDGTNVYVVVYGGYIYKLPGGTGTLIAYELVNRNWTDIAYSASGNLYATTTVSGDLHKQTALTGAFTAQGLTARNYNSISISNGNNIYVIGSDNLYKQTSESGAFNLVSTGSSVPTSVAVSLANSDVYVCYYSNVIRKQTNETGSYVDISSLLTTSLAWFVIDVIPNGNVYLSGEYYGFYLQINYTVGSPNLDGGSFKSAAGVGKGTGQSRWRAYTGQKTTSGTDMQVETLRMEIDENGYLKLTTMPTYADNTAALSGGLVAGQFYRTSTGILMITY
jgi:hypothetical protein